MHSTKLYEGKEPSKYRLMKHFIEHQERFDDECKQRMFEFGEEVLKSEAMSKYNLVSGQSKINFLALSKKS